jgi:hypothetical protein
MGRHHYHDPDPDESGANGDFVSGRFAAPARHSAESARRRRGGWENGRWRGGHRRTSAPRGVSLSVIVAVVAVVVVVAGYFLWDFLGEELSHRSSAASARCVSGHESVAVIADPSIAQAISTLGDEFNAIVEPIHDRCVSLAVKGVESDRVVGAFAGNWPADLGDRPALWIPASSVSQARLQSAVGAQTVSDSRSLVSSPILLAVSPQLKDALGNQSWATLPGLQTQPNGLDGLSLSGWGPLRLSMPLNGNGDATFLAAEAIASAPAGAAPVNKMVANQPKLADNRAATAMDALLGASNPATAPVHAVVTTEQQLYQRGESLSDPKTKLAGWLPPGPTATADYPTVLLNGGWLTPEQVSAASEFERFMRKPEHLAELARAGFRTDGAGQTPHSDIVSFAQLAAPLSVGDAAARAPLANTLATALGAPSQ